jgi:release factor glutamine methyltransferase
MGPNVGQTVSDAAKRFEAAGIDAPRLTAELLMAHALRLDRAGVIAHASDELGDKEAAEYEKCVTHRESREPLEYITGRCEFLGRTFSVGPEVLIPRPETELLAMEAVEYLRGLAQQDGLAEITAADICTGSGCIAITLALDVPGLIVHATDISQDALRIAKINSEALGASGNIRFHEGDLLAALIDKAPRGGYDIIVSNPPYVKMGELDTLQEEVRKEPVLALDGGTDGLDAVRRLIDTAPGLLKSGGRLMIEIGLGQSEEVGELVNRAGGLSRVGFINDHAGIERIVVADKII